MASGPGGDCGRTPPKSARAGAIAVAARHVPRDGVLADDVAQLGELARDSSPAPRWVLARHASDQVDDDRVERWAPRATRAPSPEADERAPVPADHRLALHDHERLGPSRPRARKHDPERAVDGTQPRPWGTATKDGELLPQSEVLGDEARSRAEGDEERADHCAQQGEHGRTVPPRRRAVSQKRRGRPHEPPPAMKIRSRTVGDANREILQNPSGQIAASDSTPRILQTLSAVFGNPRPGGTETQPSANAVRAVPIGRNMRFGQPSSVTVANSYFA